MRSYQRLPVEKFPGLNLRDQPLGGALDLLNVTFTDRGGVRARSGSELVHDTGLADVSAIGKLYTLAGDRRLILSAPTALRAMNADGSVAHDAAGGAIPTAAMQSFARTGAPGAERVYMGNGVDTVRRYDASGFTAPTCTVINALTGVSTGSLAMPKAACIATWPSEGRVIYGGFTGATDGPNGLVSDNDTAWISNENDPQTFRDSAFVRFGAGDGERTQAIVAWRDMVFWFKETKFAIFTQVTVDGDGTARFERRVVEGGVGAVGRQAVTVARDGVYFVGRNGLYRTTGGEPQLLSELLEPLWGQAPVPQFFTGGVIDPQYLSTVEIEALGSLVYLSYRHPTASGQSRTLVLDTRYGWATIWNLGMKAMLTYRQANVEEIVFVAPGLDKVQAVRDGALGDNGRPMRSFYLGGFQAIAAEQVVRIRENALWGRGQVGFGVAGDFERGADLEAIDFDEGLQLWGDGSDPDDLWGDGTTDDTWQGDLGITGQLAQYFSTRQAFAAIYLEQNPATAAESTPWAVHRVTHHIAGGKAVADIKDGG